jgi:hypothetical protein
MLPWLVLGIVFLIGGIIGNARLDLTRLKL